MSQDRLRESARHWAREIVTGHVSPIDGARAVVREGAGELDTGGELMVFAGLVGEWEDDESRRASPPAPGGAVMDEPG
ncbi:MAG: hypothetical protein ACRD0C_11715 [Acidimicrobiia bacterium]